MNGLKKLIDSSQKKEWALMQIVLVCVTKAKQLIKKKIHLVGALITVLEGESNIMAVSRKVDITLED